MKGEMANEGNIKGQKMSTFREARATLPQTSSLAAERAGPRSVSSK